MWSYESVLLLHIILGLVIVFCIFIISRLTIRNILNGDSDSLICISFWLIWLSILIPIETWETHHTEYYFPELTQQELCTLIELDETTNIHAVEIVDYDESEGIYKNVTLDFIVTRPNKDELKKIDGIAVHYDNIKDYKLNQICGD